VSNRKQVKEPTTTLAGAWQKDIMRVDITAQNQLILNNVQLTRTDFFWQASTPRPAIAVEICGGCSGISG
jgi:hypothetical protein